MTGTIAPRRGSARRYSTVAFVLALSLMAPARLPGQTTWHVDAANCPGPGTGTPGDPFCSIQDGIIAAINGDAVEVAAGAYLENIDLLGKAVTLYSSGGAAVTTIDAGGVGTVVTCTSGEGPATIIDGFTITGGSSGIAAGGGMTINSSSPTVTNCTFIANSTTWSGGAMYIAGGGSPTVTNYTFSGNTAAGGEGVAKGLGVAVGEAVGVSLGLAGSD